jgi:GntR family transcriptional regulator/MocR family aminotransferase
VRRANENLRKNHAHLKRWRRPGANLMRRGLEGSLARPVLGMIGPTRKGKDLALAQVVFENLRNRILDGLWRHGEKLPGTRLIAKDAGVSRWTAVMAVDMLIAEGLVEARKRSGTYVNWSGSGPELRPDMAAPGQAEGPKPHVPFAVGVPGLDLFPMQVWRRLQAKRWKDMPVDALQTGHDGGWPELRAAIASHVGATRGIKCAPSQVFVTTSAHAAVILAGEVLCRTGSVVWMEEPGYFRTRAALQGAGLAPVPVMVDAEGISIADGRRLAPKAAMAVVTSSYQFPTGVALSDARKQELLAWSNQVGSFILEDDFACEFRRGRSATTPLAALPGAQRVVYMNTFSTTIFPSLRLSYLMVPRAIADRFAEALQRTERYATIPNQIVLADFVSSGQFAKHIRRCRDAYAERTQVLLESLREECAGLFAVLSPAGMHVCARFAQRRDDAAVAAAAREAGLIVEPLSRFYAAPTTDSGLLLGFAGFRPDALRDAAKRLAKVLATVRIAPGHAVA